MVEQKPEAKQGQERLLGPLAEQLKPIFESALADEKVVNNFTRMKVSGKEIPEDKSCFV